MEAQSFYNLLLCVYNYSIRKFIVERLFIFCKYYHKKT